MKLLKILAVGFILTTSISLSSSRLYSQDQDANKQILRNAVVGAGSGAIAASASGGKAGTGALIGAGTTVIGGAVLDTLTTPSQPQQQPVQYVQDRNYQPVQVAPSRGCSGPANR